MRIVSFFFLISLALFICSPLVGQESEVLKKELGLRFSGFDDFNLMYKKETAKGKYRRHRVLIGKLSFNSNRTDYDFNLGYAFGVEKRKVIKDKLSFISGPDVLLSFAYSNTEGVPGDRNTQLIIVPALGYILGFQLDISSSFSVSAEIIPSISGNLAIYDYSDNQYRITAELNSTATALCLMYKF